MEKITVEEWIALRVCIRGIVGTWKLLWLIRFGGRDDNMEPDEDTREDYQMCRSGPARVYDPLRQAVFSLFKKQLISFYSCLEPDGEMIEVTDEPEVKKLTDDDIIWKNEPKAGKYSYYVTSTDKAEDLMRTLNLEQFRNKSSRL